MNRTRLMATATALMVASVVAMVFVLNGSTRPPAVQVLPADGVIKVSDFNCGVSTLPAQASGATALVSTIRAGAHPGYDRLVVEFASGVPGSITVTPQERPMFTNSPRGDAVTLAGAAGLKVVMQGADAHTAYSGPQALRPNGAALVEIRRVEDFEGYVALGIGVAQPACYRASMLTSPTRLVIDVQVR